MTNEPSLAVTKGSKALPRVEHGLGYQIAAVDAFLLTAGASIDAGDGAVTAAQIRQASFPLAKHGYVTSSVDQRLEALEEAVALRERTAAISEEGADAWLARARERGQEILDRLSRRRGRRFARTGFLTFGYRVEEVDAVADRIARFLRDGEALQAQQLRRAAFRMRRRGYREEQVDAVLDASIEVILAVR